MLENVVVELTPEHMRMPCWRYAIATRYSADPTLPEFKILSDTTLAQAVRFYRGRSDLKNRPEFYAMSFPAMWEAHLLNTANKEFGGYKWQLEAMILTGADNATIANALKLTAGADTVEVYKKVFFDVDSYLDNRNCLLAQILSTSILTGSSYADYDYTWKAIALEWGFEGFQRFIEFKCGGRLPSDMKSWLDEVSKDRLSYATYHNTSHIRSLHKEEAMNILSTAQSHWNIRDDKTDEVKTQAANAAARSLLDGINMVMTDKNLERRIAANNEAVEPRLFTYPSEN
jgi:hypothetical protein